LEQVLQAGWPAVRPPDSLLQSWFQVYLEVFGYYTRQKNEKVVKILQSLLLSVLHESAKYVVIL